MAELSIAPPISIGFHTFPGPFEVRKDHVTSSSQWMDGEVAWDTSEVCGCPALSSAAVAIVETVCSR